MKRQDTAMQASEERKRNNAIKLKRQSSNTVRVKRQSVAMRQDEETKRNNATR